MLRAMQQWAVSANTGAGGLVHHAVALLRQHTVPLAADVLMQFLGALDAQDIGVVLDQ